MQSDKAPRRPLVPWVAQNARHSPSLRQPPKPRCPPNGESWAASIEVKRAHDEPPPAMRYTPCLQKRALRAILLSNGKGGIFSSMGATYTAWRSVRKGTTRDLWPDLCVAKSPATLKQVLLETISQNCSVDCVAPGGHRGAKKTTTVLDSVLSVQRKPRSRRGLILCSRPPTAFTRSTQTYLSEEV